MKAYLDQRNDKNYEKNTSKNIKLKTHILKSL